MALRPLPNLQIPVTTDRQLMTPEYFDYVRSVDAVLRPLANGLLDAADDTAAAMAGVLVGGLYHTSGAVKVRLT